MFDNRKQTRHGSQAQNLSDLEARHAGFFADVHGMPSLIGKLFAIPSMKGYNDRVVLDRDGTSADQYPGMARSAG